MRFKRIKKLKWIARIPEALIRYEKCLGISILHRLVTDSSEQSRKNSPVQYSTIDLEGGETGFFQTHEVVTGSGKGMQGYIRWNENLKFESSRAQLRLLLRYLADTPTKSSCGFANRWDTGGRNGMQTGSITGLAGTFKFTKLSAVVSARHETWNNETRMRGHCNYYLGDKCQIQIKRSNTVITRFRIGGRSNWGWSVGNAGELSWVFGRDEMKKREPKSWRSEVRSSWRRFCRSNKLKNSKKNWWNELYTGIIPRLPI